MEYGDRMDKARSVFTKKDRLNESIQNSLNKIKQSANNVEKLIYKYNS